MKNVAVFEGKTYEINGDTKDSFSNSDEPRNFVIQGELIRRPFRTSTRKPAILGRIIIEESAYEKRSLLNGSKTSRTCVHHLLTYVLDLCFKLVILCGAKGQRKRMWGGIEEFGGNRGGSGEGERNMSVEKKSTR